MCRDCDLFECREWSGGPHADNEDCNYQIWEKYLSYLPLSLSRHGGFFPINFEYYSPALVKTRAIEVIGLPVSMIIMFETLDGVVVVETHRNAILV